MLQSDKLDTGKRFFQDRDSHKVIRVGVGGVNVLQLLLGNGLSNPLCKGLPLLDSNRSIDEGGGIGTMDKNTADG